MKRKYDLFLCILLVVVLLIYILNWRKFREGNDNADVDCTSGGWSSLYNCISNDAPAPLTDSWNKGVAIGFKQGSGRDEGLTHVFGDFGDKEKSGEIEKGKLRTCECYGYKTGYSKGKAYAEIDKDNTNSASSGSSS